MPSPPGYMNSRSAKNHAGIPAIITVPFTLGAAGEKQIVEGPEDGRKIRLHAYTMTGRVAGRVTLMSSGASTETSLIGQMQLAAGTPITQDAGLNGLGDCVIDADLAVSSVTTGVDGNISYSIIPPGA